MGLSDITHSSVLAAVAEYDEAGRDVFLTRHGFGRATVYFLIHGGKRYDSKAILGVAHRYAVGYPLRSDDFTGGEQAVARRLRRLGFNVEGRTSTAPRPSSRQTLVLIAPSYGNPASRARFSDTLAQPVSFLAPPLKATLRDEELDALLKLHPDGSARFWGALARHDSKMDRLATGDHILFTGDNQVQAIGKLGCKLRNQALADLLWQPDPKTGGWSNVYSVVDFRLVHDLGYSEIQVLAGYKPRDVFQETRVPSPEQAAALIAGLGLDGADSGHDDEDALAEETLVAALNDGSVIFDAEGNHTDTTEYERKAGKVILRRAEARLVARYRQTLPDSQAHRLKLDVGWSDLYIIEDADLIEAKRSAAHRYVRDALGQLLDYAAHASHPVNRLTAMFPERPADRDIRLLHMYGIDCLHWAGGDIFHRLEAPQSARERVREAWSAPGPQ
ncbi:hypothetical protein [Plantactinospora endophytica]|uniref:ScoMcrA-like N-terminal head domain-containing protein n=1 Tax=Plantactinospora endophytica TaxID=673535 RepID=A0ABQ4E4K5_9ACTN|nr:hypothetical protein [Plantactinospora endophytica]GIG89252.1 hypothetical protein Pen02_41880 [Plantactinospora endophytica]